MKAIIVSLGLVVILLAFVRAVKFVVSWQKVRSEAKVLAVQRNNADGNEAFGKAPAPGCRRNHSEKGG